MFEFAPASRFPSRPGKAIFRRHRNFFTLASIILVAIFCAAGQSGFLASAQDAASQQQPIQATTELVKIDVSVLNANGDYVGGLTKKDFRVLDHGVEQPLAVFTSDQAPAKVVVMIETSPAVYLIQQQHLAGANALLDGLAPDDQVAVVAYDESPRELVGFTSDKTILADSFHGLVYSMGAGQLNLFDSISRVMDDLAAIQEKKALVLLSTGLDSSPPERWDVLKRKLQTQDVVVFPVALGGSLRLPPDKKKKTAPLVPRDPDNPLSFAKATQYLREMATITGGRAFFPESSADFVPAYHQVASALRNQYVLGIAPEHDGKFHALEVQLLDAAGAPIAASPQKPVSRVYARQGYIAPAP